MLASNDLTVVSPFLTLCLPEGDDHASSVLSNPNLDSLTTSMSGMFCSLSLSIPTSSSFSSEISFKQLDLICVSLQDFPFELEALDLALDRCGLIFAD